MTTQPYKLSPSDLTFLWDECPRCFYLKVVSNFGRPRAPFPSIFTKIDGIMKAYFQDMASAEIHPELPAGRVSFADRWVESLPISLPNRKVRVYIRGKFDSILAFDNGGYGLVDFKTSQARPSHLEFYSHQLHAYCYALENPAAGKFSVSPVTRLGLLVVEPQQMVRMPAGETAYLGSTTWQEIPRDDQAFLAFLDRVVGVLEQPSPPDPHPECSYCQYRHDARISGL